MQVKRIFGAALAALSLSSIIGSSARADFVGTQHGGQVEIENNQIDGKVSWGSSPAYLQASGVSPTSPRCTVYMASQQKGPALYLAPNTTVADLSRYENFRRYKVNLAPHHWTEDHKNSWNKSIRSYSVAPGARVRMGCAGRP